MFVYVKPSRPSELGTTAYDDTYAYKWSEFISHAKRGVSDMNKWIQAFRLRQKVWSWERRVMKRTRDVAKEYNIKKGTASYKMLLMNVASTMDDDFEVDFGHIE